jgi:hypothetical protein
VTTLSVRTSRDTPRRLRRPPWVHADFGSPQIPSALPEQHLVEQALEQLSATLPNQDYRDLLKEVLDEGLKRALKRLEEYAEFEPDLFNLKEVNDRLKRFMPYGRVPR